MTERSFLTPIGPVDVVPAFSGLRNIVRRFKVSATIADADDNRFRAYGTADDEFPLALLVEKRLAPASPARSWPKRFVSGLACLSAPIHPTA